MAARLTELVIDANDPDALATFWTSVLGWEVASTDDEGVVIADPSGRLPTLMFARVPEAKAGKNRLHLDLYSDDQHAEVERLLALGATRHPRVPEPDDDFVLLQDPEGNVFCVVDTTYVATPPG